MISTYVMRGPVAMLALMVAAQAARGQNPPPKPPAQQPVVVTPAAPTAAQAAAAGMGKNVSNEQISDAIKKSGLSQQQIQDKLRSAGYDPAMADPFFGAQRAAQLPGAPGAAGAAAQPTAQTDAFAKALSALGLLDATGEKTTDDAKAKKADETEIANAERVSARAGGVFGKEIFAAGTNVFDPVTSGPVDPSYRVGVGDQLQVIVTGQVELAYALDIRRDGTVVIPQVGQVSLAGLTLDGARALLKSRMSRSYSGLANGEAQLDLTLSRIRSNVVFVIGEVEQPGSYQVNALSTVFHALVRAGGPTVRGSFRNIEIRRGGVLLRTVDLYDYLLRGDASNDIRTEQGDVIFVPLNTRAVAITGAVRRPRIFELKPGEGFDDLINFAGGFLATASFDMVQVERVVPPEQRQPGFDRVRIDVPLHGNLAAAKSFALQDADRLTVLSIGDLQRNVVTVGGAVFQPGEFEMTKGMTLDSLLRKAQGTLPWALVDRVKLRRQITATGRSESFSFNLADSSARAFPLAEFDQVLVLDGRVAFPAGSFAISGAVRRPFAGPYVEKATLKDLVDLAGGFEEYALPDRIKVERPIFETGRSELYSVDFRADSGKGFALARGDRVTVLDARTAFPARIVSVSGEVVSGGSHPYVEHETLKDAIERSGGFTESAVRLEVARRTVGVAFTDTTSTLFDFALDAGLRLPDVAARFVLEPDDRVLVRGAPGFRAQRMVSVAGMFAHPGEYAITSGTERVRDVVARAGGLLPTAYAGSFKLTREGKVVGIDFDAAMRGNRDQNIELQAGDQIFIAENPKTVFVTGAVIRPSLLVYQPGLSALDYIELAGGATDNGNAKKAVVDYMSGYSQRVRSWAGMVYQNPSVTSGATITVPVKPEDKGWSSEAWTRLFGVTSALTSLVLAVVAIKRL